MASVATKPSSVEIRVSDRSFPRLWGPLNQSSMRASV